MATTVAVSDLTQATALSAGDSIPYLRVADTTQSPGGSVDRITASDFFGATTRVPLGFYQGLGTVTVSTPASDSTATWNDVSVTFTHLKVNVTVAAAAPASKFIDLQAGGVSQFTVGKAGAVAFLGDLAINTNKFNVTAASGNTAIAGTLAQAGIAAFAAKIVMGGADTTNAQTTDIVLANATGIRGANALNNTSLGMMTLTSSNIIQMGADAASSGAGHLMIPYIAAVNLPAAGASKNGIEAIDSTNNRFIFYSGGNRYYVTGTSF